MPSAYSMVFKDQRLRTPALILIALGFTYASVMPYQSVIAINQMGLSEGAYSLLVFASSLVSVSASLIFGALSDHSIDRRLLIMRLCALGAIGFGAVYIVPSPLVFVICTMTLIPLCSCANSLLFATVRAEVVTLDRATSASVTSVVRAGFASAFAVAPGLVGLWLSTQTTMISAYAIAFVACAISLLLYLSSRSRPAAPSAGTEQRPSLLRSLGRIFSRRIMVAVITISALSALIRVNNIVTPLIITGFPHGSVAQVGLNSGLCALLEIPFMILWGHLQRRWRTAYVLALGASLYCAYLALLSCVTEPYQIYALLVINAGGAAAILSVSIVYLQDLIIDRPGLGSSLISITTCISAGMAALVFAFGTALATYSATALIAAAIGIAALISLLLIENMREPGKST